MPANPVHALFEAGQSVWLDFIRRDLLTSGELERLVDGGLISGVTSNPTIFQQAIAGTRDYDAALEPALARAGSIGVGALRRARDRGHPEARATGCARVYDRDRRARRPREHRGQPAARAHDTAGTIDEARRLLTARSARPNVMIKVPATAEGLPAIRALDRRRHLRQRHAHLLAGALRAGDGGLPRRARGPRRARRAAARHDRLGRVVLRLARGHQGGRGDRRAPRRAARRATARAPSSRRCAARSRSRTRGWPTRRFREVFGRRRAGRRWRARARASQRPLWASTSTKNPAYPDALYVDELIGPDTVNTMPPETLDGVQRPRRRVELAIGTAGRGAHSCSRALPALGVPLDEADRRARARGRARVRQVVRRRCSPRSRPSARGSSGPARAASRRMLGALQPAVDARLARVRRGDEFAERLWRATRRCGARPGASGGGREPPRLARRAAARCARSMAGARGLRAPRSRAEGFTHAVLLGMGGSSLAPEVLRAHVRRRPRGGSTCTCSTTRRPARCARWRAAHDPAKHAVPGLVQVGRHDSRCCRSTRTSRRRCAARGVVAGRASSRSPIPAPRSRRSRAARLPAHVPEPGRHRRALLGAVVLRPGAGGAARARPGGPARARRSRDGSLRPARGARPRTRALALGAALGELARPGATS